MSLRLFPLAALAFLLTACGGDRAPAPAGSLLDQVRERGVVRIGVKADAPPFGQKRGPIYQGFDIDIAQAVAAKLGIERIEWVPVTSDERSDKLVAGELDLVVASMSQTRYRERRVDFTIPYFRDGQSLLVPANSSITSYRDLVGRKVGATKGSTSSFYMKQVQPEAETILYPSSAALLEALGTGEVDAITSDRLLLMALAKGARTPTAWKLVGGRFTTEPYAMAVPQDQSRWRNALNHALLSLWEDGTYQTIWATWFGPGAPYEDQISFRMEPWPK